MLDPHYIKFENPKRELYLTFSARIKNNPGKQRVLDIQEEVRGIIKKRKNLKGLEIERTRENLYRLIEKKEEGEHKGNRFIYQYPKDRLHFSIVNFAVYKIVCFNRFEKARGNIEKTNNFKSLLKEAFNFQRLFNEVFNKKISKKGFRVRVERIYLPGGIENSLALNVFPVDPPNFFKKLDSIVKLVKINLDEKLISHQIKIKAYPENNYRYFAMNIFRFIDSRNVSEEKRFLPGMKNFYRELKKINNSIKKSPFEIKGEPQIVISDPYLANKNPYLSNEDPD